MKIVVTGGAGFIGANLCRALVAQPGVTEVVAFDDLSTGFKENLQGLDLELVEASILDRAALAEAFSGAHSVVHLAARPSVPRSIVDPVASHDANATGTLYVLEAARATQAHAVVASSSSVYGATPVLPKHEDLPTRPMSPYAVSKLATEAYALAHQVSFGLPTIVFRFFNVYGPLQPAGHAYAAVVPAFISAALRGEPVTIYGDGEQTRDFTSVETVTGVLAQAAVQRMVSPDPINLAFGTRSSLVDLVELLSEVLGQPVARRHEPGRPGDVRDSQASADRLRQLFPDLQPRELRAGLAETVEWFRGL